MKKNILKKVDKKVKKMIDFVKLIWYITNATKKTKVIDCRMIFEN